MNFKHKLSFIFLCVFLLALSACGNQTVKASPENSESLDKEAEEIAFAENDEFSEFIALGSYGEFIRLGGIQRDSERVKKVDNKVAFPEGMLITLIGKTSGTVNRFIEIDPDKAEKFILQIEKASIVADEDAINPNRYQVGSEINCVLLNASGEYIGVKVTPFSDGMNRVSIWYQKDSFEEDGFFAYSEALTEEIKELTGWKFVEPEALKSAIKGKSRNENTKTEYRFNDEDLKDLVTAVINGKATDVDWKCPFDISIELVLENGESVNMLWCGDNNGIIGVEGSMYELSKEYTDRLCKLLESSGVQEKR